MAEQKEAIAAFLRRYDMADLAAAFEAKTLEPNKMEAMQAGPARRG
ncbi:MAG: hypothetical protein KGL39_01075 [Patescibacteria group bacterium]|nr:hypothetical protein [Patescibacteria group bacterium]